MIEIIIGLMVVVAIVVMAVIWGINHPLHEPIKEETKGMDLTAMCQWAAGKISKEQAEKESKERGWKK